MKKILFAALALPAVAFAQATPVAPVANHLDYTTIIALITALASSAVAGIKHYKQVAAETKATTLQKALSSVAVSVEAFTATAEGAAIEKQLKEF